MRLDRGQIPGYRILGGGEIGIHAQRRPVAGLDEGPDGVQVRRVVVAIVEGIEVSEARHEDEPSGCDARDEVKAEEQPLPIRINDAVLLVTSAVQGEEKDERRNDCGKK